MNTTRMRELADIVEKSETYDQAIYMNECGSPACLAGHAVALSFADGERFSDCGTLIINGELAVEAVWQRATESLRLTGGEAVTLFAHNAPRHWPEPFRSRWLAAGGDRRAEAKVAADFLRHLADEADAKARAEA